MTNYKKPEPELSLNIDNDRGCGISVEHYLAKIIYSASYMKDTGYWHDTAVNIIHDARKAWDLVDD